MMLALLSRFVAISWPARRMTWSWHTCAPSARTPGAWRGTRARRTPPVPRRLIGDRPVTHRRGRRGAR
ncbi:hypothetical protein, partial [Streptomyces sp. NPDC057426]|uniref:hypothetical protein n=1 Tax=Streptomyces sp. NPDC057426 TaxID=3346128 RepID=UPI0036A72782